MDTENDHVTTVCVLIATGLFGQMMGPTIGRTVAPVVKGFFN